MTELDSLNLALLDNRNQTRSVFLGQVDSIERSLSGDDNCADVLMLLATVRGGINSLMAEVLEDHIRLHLLTPERAKVPPHELAEDMIELLRAYLR